MIRLYILCEGQTEESFVNSLLCERFMRNNIVVTPIIFTTKRTPNKKFKGGISNYPKMKEEIKKLCRDKTAVITTMLDYYALPNDLPGRANPVGRDIYEKVSYVEGEMAADIAEANFIPNIIVHEFEGLLFSDSEYFVHCGTSRRNIEQLLSIRELYETPEHINDGVNTAPSKRIVAIYSNYDKVVDGITIAKDIGLDKILAECKHFRKWVQQLEGLNKE